MTDLEKFQLVNNCETVGELSKAISSLSNEDGNIQGKKKNF